MKTLRFISCFAAMACSTLVFNSCGRCGGCNSILTTKGAELIAHDAVIDRNEGTVARLMISGVSAETKGDRNCQYKDDVICVHDGLEAERLTLKCDRVLKLKSGVLEAGTDLLREKNLVQKGSEYPPLTAQFLSIGLTTGSATDTGTYTFILAGSTKDGKAVSDTATLLWK